MRSRADSRGSLEALVGRQVARVEHQQRLLLHRLLLRSRSASTNASRKGNTSQSLSTSVSSTSASLNATSLRLSTSSRPRHMLARLLTNRRLFKVVARMTTCRSSWDCFRPRAKVLPHPTRRLPNSTTSPLRQAYHPTSSHRAWRPAQATTCHRILVKTTAPTAT